jgi:hypothetical protein
VNRQCNSMRRIPQARRAGASAVPPHHPNRKALTTWQDAAALKQLKNLANDLGVSQQALIAQGSTMSSRGTGRPRWRRRVGSPGVAHHHTYVTYVDGLGFEDVHTKNGLDQPRDEDRETHRHFSWCAGTSSGLRRPSRCSDFQEEEAVAGERLSQVHQPT